MYGLLANRELAGSGGEINTSIGLMLIYYCQKDYFKINLFLLLLSRDRKERCLIE
jgi:hypothetical protein